MTIGKYPSEWPAMMRALRRAVAERSLRRVGNEVGLSWTGLRKLLERDEPGRSSERTREKVVRWYAKHGDPSVEEELDALVEQLLIRVAPPFRERLRSHIRAMLDDPEGAQAPVLTPELLKVEFFRQLPRFGWGEVLESVALILDARATRRYDVGVPASTVAAGLRKASPGLLIGLRIRGGALASALRRRARGLSNDEAAQKPAPRRSSEMRRTPVE